MKKFLSIVMLFLFLAPCASGADYVWWEGEKPTATNFPAHSPFAPSTFPNRADQLSGKDWLSTGGKRGDAVLFAKYKIAVPKEAEYSLWVRKFWAHGPFRWRFDSQPWRICDSSFGLADDTPLKKFVNANWVSLGKVKLAQGEHPFEIQLLANQGDDTACAFDCFVLTPGLFIPNGKLKPDERSGKADDGYFPFEPMADPFSPDAQLDLRGLNEKTAGQNGFLKRIGDHFALGDGTPVRFWAVDVSVANASQDRASVDYLARKLAKLGVNMVRFHGALYDKADPTRIDAKQLDNLFYLESAMKREGIYTYLSFYFPLWLNASDPHLNLPGYDQLKNKHPFALLYFDPRMQQIHRGWAKQLLDTPNPYTHLTLAQDPALGIVEIVNEDSFFFWTFTRKNIPAEQWNELENQFSQWLIAKYGSVEKAEENWGGRGLAQDSANHAGLYEAYAMTAGGVQRFGAKRIGDQVHFLADTQRQFYASTSAFLKNDLHFGGLVNPSNWFTSDPNLLAAVERWTYAGDLIDQHGYFTPKLSGEGSGYSVRAGHTFKSRASVLEPDATPLRFDRTAGYPQITSEIGWLNPNRYRADAVFLASAYGSLQGIDGLFFFAVDNNYLRATSWNSFGVASPIIAGAFPAAALIYRRGDVRRAEPVVSQIVNPADLFAMKGAATWSGNALDELRKKDIPPGGMATGEVSKIDGLSPYVGSVVRSFSPDVGKSFEKDLTKYTDRTGKTVTSLTGELHWDYGIGIARMNTPLAQGATGFLSKNGRINLGDVDIQCNNEFATILVVSLDGRPLKESKKVLIQATTQEQPYGFRTEPDGTGGERIIDLGEAPFGVKKIQATVWIKGAGGAVTSLDENGYPRGAAKQVQSASDGSTRIDLAPDAIYQVFIR
jgi:hypothetical protein